MNDFRAVAELIEAALPFSRRPVSEDSLCHGDLVPMEQCKRCSRILRLRAALKAMEDREP